MFLRIAHVSAVFPPYSSGTGIVCYHNALELARRGHRVTVFTAKHARVGLEFPEEISVVGLTTPFRVGNAPLTPGLLRLSNFDVIHLHHPFIFGAELIRTVSKVRHIPFILTHHNDLIGNGRRRHLFNAYSAISTRFVVSKASKYAVVSLDHATRCRLAPLFQKRWKDVVEVPNGVDPFVFKPDDRGQAIRAEYGIPSHARVILFVGSLDRAHHFKGIEHLIRVFYTMDDREVYLVFVGEGDMKNYFMRVASELGLAEQVIFVGNVPNSKLPPYYSAADLVVLPSFPPESFGVVLLEAMACARPVVAHNIPGVRTVVSDGRDGFLVRPGDAEDLAYKMQILLHNPFLRQEMGMHGRNKVKERYTWERIGEQLEELYRQVLDGC